VVQPRKDHQGVVFVIKATRPAYNQNSGRTYYYIDPASAVNVSIRLTGLRKRADLEYFGRNFPAIEVEG
jgi:hypothetical protein